MRVPAPAKCAGSSCSMHAFTPGTPGTPAAETPKPSTDKGILTADTGTDTGMVAVGGNGTQLQFTFKNTSAEPIANVYVTASGSGFQPAIGPVRLTTCGVAGTRRVTIQPGATCTATVNFRPTDVGVRSGAVNIVSADLSTPLASLNLTGTGGLATPLLSVDQATGLDFGTIKVGSSATRTFTYSNSGAAAYQLSGNSIWYDGAYPAQFAMARSCDGNGSGGNTYVRPGDVCTVTITITPSVPGATVSNYGDGIIPGGNITIPLRYIAN